MLSRLVHKCHKDTAQGKEMSFAVSLWHKRDDVIPSLYPNQSEQSLEGPRPMRVEHCGAEFPPPCQWNVVFSSLLDLLYNSSRDWQQLRHAQIMSSSNLQFIFLSSFFLSPCFAIRSDWKIASWTGKISSHVSSSTEGRRRRRKWWKRSPQPDCRYQNFSTFYTPEPSPVWLVQNLQLCRN